MNIKVAMIADMPEPGELIVGGVQAVSRCLARAMEVIPGVELHVIRFRPGVTKSRVYEINNHRLHVLPMARFGTPTAFVRDQRTLDRYLKSIQPDVVHSQGAGYEGILARRSIYPSVLTVHGVLSEEVRFEYGFRRRVRLSLQARISDYICIRRACHTILISQYVADYYGEKLGGERYLVANPVDNVFFDIERREKGNKVLFAGRLTQRKGVKDLLNAVAKVAENQSVHVVLAGALSDEKYVGELTLLCRQLKIEHLVCFAGSMDSEELARELAECCCLVLPSYQETAPMVIQEAMAVGVPVISTAICGIPFQIDHGETGYVYLPGDVPSLARHLETLISSPELRKRFGRNAKSKANREFLASTVAERTLDVYQRVLHDNTRCRISLA